jgi:hypothetical protein
MKLTAKLISYLNRVFDKDPAKVLAFRLRYSGTSMTWRVEDGVLTTAVTGGSGSALSIPLSSHTVATLSALLAAQAGYSVPYQDLSTFSGLSALVLLDGAGNQDESNGDHFYGYTSVLWAYMESIGNELTLLRASITEAILQMAANTASGEWVDEHGSYYNVQRGTSEADAAYAARMISEVIKARGNNVAIAAALKSAVLAESVDVTDYDTITTSSGGVDSYGLFDVTVTSYVDTTMGPEEDSAIRQIIESMRDAGTHLRTLKYLRKSTMILYVGAALKTGENVTVLFRPLFLNGSFSLDGSETLDGLDG